MTALPPLDPAAPPGTPRPRLHIWEGWILGIIVVFAGALRLLAIFDDFWFDEIWSWEIVRQLKSPLDVLTLPQAQSDNNHPLNTLFMYLIGPNQLSWPI